MSASHDNTLTFQLKDLYNKYRTALMNREYYGCRLAQVRKKNRNLEIAIAIGTSSAVASWAVWRDSAGELIWALVTAIATVLAIIKPFINYPKDIERYSKLFVGHGDVYFDLDRIVNSVRQNGGFEAEVLTAYEESIERIKELAAHDDPEPDEGLLRKCYTEVNERIPAHSLWTPN